MPPRSSFLAKQANNVLWQYWPGSLPFLAFPSLTVVTGPSPRYPEVRVGDKRTNLGHICQVGNSEQAQPSTQGPLGTGFCRKAQGCEDQRGHPAKHPQFYFCFSHLRCQSFSKGILHFQVFKQNRQGLAKVGSQS